MTFKKYWIAVLIILISALAIPSMAYSIQVYQTERPDGLSGYSTLSQVTSRSSMSDLISTQQRTGINDLISRFTGGQTSITASSGSVSAFSSYTSTDPIIDFHERVSVDGLITNFRYSAHWESGAVR